jgi:6-phosphogluconolactonase (cycloisomerase 2 family)
MYDLNSDGTLRFVDEVHSHEQGDGPRHNVPSQDGHYLFVVRYQPQLFAHRA